MDILLVEDEVLVAAALVQELEAAGHRVLGPAQTVEDALDIAESERFDLGLLNINLKAGGDGTELARVLLARYCTPVIFISGSMAQARGAQDVAIGYLAKPCSPAIALKAVAFAEGLVRGPPGIAPPSALEVYPNVEAKLGRPSGALSHTTGP